MHIMGLAIRTKSSLADHYLIMSHYRSLNRYKLSFILVYILPSKHATLSESQS